MKYALLSCGLLILACTACQSPEQKAQRLEKRILREMPALFAGEILPRILTPAALDSITQRCRSYRLQADALGARHSSPKANTALLRIDQLLTDCEARLSAARSDPSWYNLGGHLKTTLAQRDIPLPKRLATLHDQMALTKDWYAAARQNLRSPQPDNTRLAIRKHLLALEFLRQELPDSIAQSSLPEAEKQRCLQAAANTQLQVKDYIAFCQSLLFEHQDSLLRQNK